MSARCEVWIDQVTGRVRGWRYGPASGAPPAGCVIVEREPTKEEAAEFDQDRARRALEDRLCIVKAMADSARTIPGLAARCAALDAEAASLRAQLGV